MKVGVWILLHFFSFAGVFAEAKPLSGNFIFKCQSDRPTDGFQVRRVDDELYIFGNAHVVQNLSFLVQALHDSENIVDLDGYLNQSFTFSFVTRLNEAPIESVEVESSLNKGPYNRREILRKIMVNKPKYKLPPRVPVTVVVGTNEPKLRFTIPLAFRRIDVVDQVGLMNELTTLSLLGSHFRNYLIKPNDCISGQIER